MLSFKNDFLAMITLIQKDIKYQYIDGLVQEIRNSIAYALELRLSYTNP